MDINNLSDINNKLSVLNKVDKTLLNGKMEKVSSKKSNVSENDFQKNVVKKTSPEELLTKLSVPVNKSSKTTVDLMTKMGKPLNKENISNILKDLPVFINQFGEKDLKSIILLKLLNINISDSTIDLGNFIINSIGKEFSSEILHSLNSISELLPQLFKRFTIKSDGENNRLFLKLDSKISADSILDLFQLLGYRGKKDSLTHLLRILSSISGKDKTFEKISNHDKTFTNLVDTQKLIHNSGEYNLYFTLPLLIDDEYSEANFEYKEEKKGNSTLSLYLELSKLGPMRISFIMEGKFLNINFYVEKKESKEILSSDFETLKKFISSKGILIKSINIYESKKENLIIRPLPLDFNNEYSHFETMG